jgi:hypothetical protein
LDVRQQLADNTQIRSIATAVLNRLGAQPGELPGSGDVCVIHLPPPREYIGSKAGALTGNYLVRQRILN